MKKIIASSLSKEQIQQLKSTVKIPENCESFRTPRLNPEIWAALPARTKLNDVKQQSVQQNFSYGLAAFATIVDNLTKVQSQMPSHLKEFSKEMVKICVAGANFMSCGLRESSHKRRQNIRPHLNSQFAGICSYTSENSTLLFGENLSEKLKQSRSVSNIMKYSSSRPFASGHLNYRGQTRRFRGQQRGRPYQRYPRRPYQRYGQSSRYGQDQKYDQYQKYDQFQRQDQFQQ